MTFYSSTYDIPRRPSKRQVAHLVKKKNSFLCIDKRRPFLLPLFQWTLHHQTPRYQRIWESKDSPVVWISASLPSFWSFDPRPTPFLPVQAVHSSAWSSILRHLISQASISNFPSMWWDISITHHLSIPLQRQLTLINVGPTENQIDF